MDELTRLKFAIYDLNDDWLRSPEFKENGEPTSRRSDLLSKLGNRAAQNAMFLQVRNGTEYNGPPISTHAIVLPGEPMLSVHPYARYIGANNLPFSNPAFHPIDVIDSYSYILGMGEMNLKELETLHKHLSRPQRLGGQAIRFTLFNQIIHRNSDTHVPAFA